jgi:LysM repeat protein
MQVKWLVPVLVGASLLSACGDSPTATSTTAVNLSSTAYQTLPPTESTLPVETTLPTEGQVSVDAQQYTIASGDYLVGIATRFGVTADAIALANNWADGINHPLFPGDLITIPGGAIVPPPTTVPVAPTGTTVAPASTVAPNSNGCTPGTYVIAAGDLPGTVAKQFDVTLDQLNAANANTKGYGNFIVGVTIVIPCP